MKFIKGLNKGVVGELMEDDFCFYLKSTILCVLGLTEPARVPKG